MRGLGSIVAFVVALIASASVGRARDAFDAVECHGDIAKVLVGAKIGDEPVAVIEKRHAAIGLRNEGGDEISDALSFQSWTICGGSYHLLERDGVIRDIVRADHSRSAPSFLGTCTGGGTQSQATVFAILEAGAASSLHAQRAWHIDESRAKFVKMDTTNLLCPRSGIATSDGGRPDPPR